MVQGPTSINSGMCDTLGCKRAATEVVKTLGLQPDVTARALVLVAADSTAGNNLRSLIQLNETDPDLRAYVEHFFIMEDKATHIPWKDNLQIDDKLAADMKSLLAG